jgi:hypothetical protein
VCTISLAFAAHSRDNSEDDNHDLAGAAAKAAEGRSDGKVRIWRRAGNSQRLRSYAAEPWHGLAEMLRPEHLGAMLWEPKRLGGQSACDRAVVAGYVVFTRGNLRLVSIRT